MADKNTKFYYMYRDAANYKQFGEIVFSGKFTPRDKELILQNLLDSENFIPGDVGIPSLCNEFGDIDPTLDHPRHELDFDGGEEGSFLSLTDEDPTDPMGRNIHEFALAFSNAKWNEVRASKDMGLWL